MPYVFMLSGRCRHILPKLGPLGIEQETYPYFGNRPFPELFVLKDRCNTHERGPTLLRTQVDLDRDSGGRYAAKCLVQ